MMLLFVGLVALTGWWFTQAADRLPSDRGPGLRDRRRAAARRGVADADRAVVSTRSTRSSRRRPGVDSWFLIGGLSILDQAGRLERRGHVRHVHALGRADRQARAEPGGDPRQPDAAVPARSTRRSIFAFPPPAIHGLGVAGGFQMQVEDRGGVGLDELQQVARRDDRSDGNAQTGLQGLQSTFRAGVPQLYVDIDREKAKSLDVPLDVVFGTLQASLGSAYVNDFNKFGRTYQVRVQADQQFRLEPEDIRRLEVRNRKGEMVPLGTLVTVEKRLGPQIIPRYNLYPSASINGEAAAGLQLRARR